MVKQNNYHYTLIAGFGITGRSAYKFLKSLNQDVLIYNDKPIESFNTITNIENLNKYKINEIVMSPGFSPEHKLYKYAKESNINTITDIDLYCRHNKSKKIFITGTNGKSTTISLLNHILNVIEPDSSLVMGNIGKSPCDVVYGNHQYSCIEVSSCQMDIINKKNISEQSRSVQELKDSKVISVVEKNTIANLAILTNISPDHLDRYKTFADYKRSKEQIFNIAQKVFTQKEFKNIDITGYTIPLQLNSSHGIDNFKACLAILQELNLTEENKNKIQQAIDTFKGLPHRYEFVTKKNNVTYINDSKSTTVDSTLKAIEGNDKKALLIGGDDKGVDISILFDDESINQNIELICLYGECANKVYAKLMEKNIHIKVIKTDTLTQAFKEANNFCKKYKKDITLFLSPACASFDQFKNFEERGEIFKELVFTQ